MATLEEIQAEAQRRGIAPPSQQDAIRAEAIRRGIIPAEAPVEPVAAQVPTEQPVAPSAAVEAPVPTSEQDFQTASQEAEEILGLDPDITERAMFGFFAQTKSGQPVFAVPQIAVDVARDILTPLVKAKRGEPITAADVTQTAFAVGAPAAKGLLAGKAVTKAGRLTAKQIAEAPTALDLTRASGLKFKGAKQAGAALSPDDFVGFLAGAERDLITEGIDAVLHPKLTGVFNALTKRIGSDLDAQDLHNVRRTIGIATQSLEPDEARIARVLRDNFDDFVENLPGTDQWKKARSIYIQARKAETVEKAIEKAGRGASGLENGLRIEFRKLLNNERATRNFTKAEKKAMQDVVDGDFTTNTLKKIGRLSFGTGQQSGFLGGSIGVGAGAAAAGPVGAVLAPAIGAAAQRGAQRGTQRAADLLRALIGGARADPITRVTDPGLIPRAIAGGVAAGGNNE